MPRKPFRGVEFQHTQAASSSRPDEPQHEPLADDRDDEIVMGDLQIQDAQGRVRMRRGPTRARDVWQLKEGERIMVTCNNLGQPINRLGSLLSSFLGTVARKCQLCPINYARWNDMLPTYKVELLRVVQSKFVIPPDSHDWIMKSLNCKWKENKAKLKKDYKMEGMTEEQVARSCPPDVYPHQWIELVHYWFSERGQVYSNIGRAARLSQFVPHTSGSKSYARRRAEFVEEHGREPGEIEFYRMTHTHHDGSFVREESREIMNRATTLIAERIGESSSSEEHSRVEAEVFTENMGPEHCGRVRGYGVGVTPTHLSAVSRYTRESRESSSTAEVHRLERQMQEMNQKHKTEMEEMNQRHKAEMEELKENYQTEIGSLRTQVDDITSFLRGFAPHRGPGASSNH